MATLASITRERKKALRYLRSLLKKVDTQIEITQRRMKRLISRKEIVPELEDLDKLGKNCEDIDTLAGIMLNGYADILRYFQL